METSQLNYIFATKPAHFGAPSRSLQKVYHPGPTKNPTLAPRTPTEPGLFNAGSVNDEELRRLVDDAFDEAYFKWCFGGDQSTY